MLLASASDENNVNGIQKNAVNRNQLIFALISRVIFMNLQVTNYLRTIYLHSGGSSLLFSWFCALRICFLIFNKYEKLKKSLRFEGWIFLRLQVKQERYLSCLILYTELFPTCGPQKLFLRFSDFLCYPNSSIVVFETISFFQVFKPKILNIHISRTRITRPGHPVRVDIITLITYDKGYSK
jgi:hypothetical protein